MTLPIAPRRALRGPAITFHSLEALGWTPALAQALAELPEPSGLDISGPGRVARVDRGEVTVAFPGENRRALSDSQRAQDQRAPATGDWVQLVDDPDLGTLVHSILPRRTAIVRRDPAEQVVEQVIVANIDVVGVVHGLDQPVNPARLERFLILAMDSGADPLIVLSKADLSKNPRAAVREASVVGDVPVLLTSAIDGSGVADLGERIGAARTIVFLGASGAGKSELVNALAGEAIQAVGEVREGDAKGRHTTTRRELIGPLPGGGIVIDTPGIRAVGVWEADLALDRVFSDIVDCSVDCKFRDCTHRQEPGCAVTAAVEAGDIDPQRLERYLHLWDEITNQAVEAEERLRKSKRGRPQG